MTQIRRSGPVSRITAVWILLVAATGLSWFLGQDVTRLRPRDIGTLVLVIAFLKVRLIILDFMELRNAPLPIRIGVEIWVLGILVTILVLYRT